MDRNWILSDLEAALVQFEEALRVAPAGDLIRAGCIQYFEFCFELAWKSIKHSVAAQGLTDCVSPKGCVREAFRLGWIDHEEIWLKMLEAWNKMAHTYNAKAALVIYEALPGFLPEMKGLLERLQAA